ncbi:MAG: hypothetical protein IJR73_08110 [Bacteroidales bacterium]|nr:hypothetical protein [Bacteroidales bacterium]
MSKKLLKNLDVSPSMTDADFLYGRSTSAGKNVKFPVSLLLGDGYACRRWNQDHSTPVGEAVGNIDYLRNLPSLLGLGCYLVDDAHNRRKLDPTNHYKLATGETARLDGTMGQYMWGTRTPFYIAIWNEGSYQYKAASLKPIPGKENYRIPIFSVAAGHAGIMDRTNDKLCSVINTAAQYRGGNGAAIASGTASADNLSQLGYPATEIGISTFEAKAAKRGIGWGAGWGWIETVIELLFEIIMGTQHCQTAFNATKDANGLFQGGLGAGISGMPSWDAYNGYHPVVPYSAGTTVYTAPIPVFFGLKNLYGHLWVGKNRIIAKKASDGSYDFYVAKSSKTPWDYSDTANMLYVGSLGARAEAGWDYISKMNFNGLAGVPSECAGTSSTYYADGAYRDIATSGFRSPLGSGTASLGGHDGLACFYGDSAPSHATAYLSSPLCETPDDFDPVPIIVSA